MPRAFLKDLYHWLITIPWSVFFAIVLLIYIGINGLFATLYLLAPGSILHARPGSFFDAFAFSVQSFATIGYGSMSPGTGFAHVLVTVEAIVALIVTAMITGLMFAKFSRPTARVIFSNVAVILPFDASPTLMFRMANIRSNQIVDANIEVLLARDETSLEGESFRRMETLELMRDRSSMFVLSWTAMHVIDESSPLHGLTQEDLESSHAELIVALRGIDGTFSQTIHARHSYMPDEIMWNSRFRDVLSRDEEGMLQVDFEHFHDVEPCRGNKLSERLVV